jgi:hypothetical protein
MYSYGTPLTRLEFAGAAVNLRSRVALHAGVQYELSIVLSDGTRRNGFGPYAHVTRRADGVQTFSFEDDADNDFNDVILRLDPTDCLTFQVSELPQDAVTAHQVWLTVYWDGVAQGDILVFENTLKSQNKTASINVANHHFFGVSGVEDDIPPEHSGIFAGLFRWIGSWFR